MMSELEKKELCNQLLEEIEKLFLYSEIKKYKKYIIIIIIILCFLSLIAFEILIQLNTIKHIY